MVRLYMDENVQGAITRELLKRGVDVFTVQQDGHTGSPDPEVLERATTLGRVLFTHDDDLFIEAARLQQAGRAFSGVIFAHQERVTIGQCVQDLELMAQTGSSEDFADRVYYLPL